MTVPLVLDNGWKIVLGRGLDIFQKTNGWYDIAEYYQEKRLCKACEITICKNKVIMDVLKPDNYIERINSYTDQDWKPLLDLIPKIEKVEKFGDDSEAMKHLEQGIIDMYPYVEHEILEEFREVLYSIPIAIDFVSAGKTAASNANGLDT